MTTMLFFVLVALQAVSNCEALSWFQASNPNQAEEKPQLDQFSLPNEGQLIQCSPELVKSYNSVPPVSGPGFGDLNWCRSTMKRAKTIM